MDILLLSQVNCWMSSFHKKCVVSKEKISAPKRLIDSKAWCPLSFLLAMGYSKKYSPPPPMDDIELGTQKFQDSQEGQLQFLQDYRAY